MIEYRLEFIARDLPSQDTASTILSFARKLGSVREVVGEKTYYLVSSAPLETLDNALCIFEGVRLTQLQGNFLRD